MVELDGVKDLTRRHTIEGRIACATSWRTGLCPGAQPVLMPHYLMLRATEKTDEGCDLR